MRRARFIPLFFSLVCARGLSAQWQATGEVGVSNIEQPGIPRSSAQTFGATIDALMRRAGFRASGLATRTTTERWTAQGTAVVSLLGPLDQRVRWDVSGLVSSFAETNAQTASSAELLGRASMGDGMRGGSLLVGGGTRVADAGRQPFGRASLGGWIGVARERFGLDLSGVRTSTTPLRSTRRDPLWYSDVSVSWRHDQGAFSIGAVGGARTSNSELIPNGVWGTVDGLVWFARHAAIVAAAGRSPQDVVRGVPRITFASLSLRLSAQPRVPELRPRPAGRGPHVFATRDRLEIRLDSATSVEVMADFTEWAPVALQRVGNVWRLERALSPGLHRLAIRIDGADWTTPTNLPTATDDLGGRVALVTVP